MAARVKVIDLAKELGVTSKDLIVALEAMGQKAMRAMSPLQAATANELRVKLGRGRDLPEEAKPKRVPKAKPAPRPPLPLNTRAHLAQAKAICRAQSTPARTCRVVEPKAGEPRPFSSPQTNVGGEAPRRSRDGEGGNG